MIIVKRGQKVKQGQVIGYVDSKDKRAEFDNLVWQLKERIKI